MIHHWKRALLEGASGVFERGSRKAPEVDEEQVNDPLVPLTGNTCLHV
jgi:transposase